MADMETMWSMEAMAISAPLVHDIFVWPRWIIIALMFAQMAVLAWRFGKPRMIEYSGIIGTRIITLAVGYLVAGNAILEAAAYAWNQRLATMPNEWWAWVLGFLLVDYWGYWVHRLKHESALFWSVHESHHSGEQLDMSVPLRNTNFDFAIVWIGAQAPLAFLGFHPMAIGSIMFISSIVQLANHAYGIMGPSWLDRIVVTPAVHAIHHAKNLPFLDKNCGEMFTFWDQIHGTYVSPATAAKTGPKLVFGDLLGPAGANPFVIAYRGFWELIAHAWKQPTGPTKLACLLASPGWSAHEGSRWTVKGMREAANIAGLAMDENEVPLMPIGNNLRQNRAGDAPVVLETQTSPPPVKSDN